MPWLPASLPEKPRLIWERKLAAQGLAGVAATDRTVIVVDRELGDTHDAFLALDAETGKQRWVLRYVAEGRLDYGNSPRATPLIHNAHAYLLGAFGRLTCVELDSGEIVWDVELLDEYKSGEKLVWGVCSSPLIVDGKLIVNPGAPDASLVALDPATGNEIWKTPGDGPGFASFIVAEFGGTRQIVGYDKSSLGGWDPANGQRLWKLVPPHKNDFNVPTPIAAGKQLLVATENNGTRLYAFDDQGRIKPEPIARNDDLAPDTHTPLVLGQRVFGLWSDLFCLDLAHGLKTIWSDADPAFGDYASLVGSGTRALLTTHEGELILFDAAADRYRVLGRAKLFTDDAGVYSHPAFVGHRLYIRGSTHLRCLSLDPE